MTGSSSMNSTSSPTSALALLLCALMFGACGGEDDEEPVATVTVEQERTDAAEPPPSREVCTTIVIDPGHDSRANSDTEPIGPGSSTRKIKDGGGTRGASTGTPEHEVTLAISLALRRELKARGYCVKMTRTRATGTSMGNVARARIANRAGAELFVRVHADGSPDRSRNGTFVIYPALRRGWTDDILPESKTAARLVQRELVSALGSRDLGLSERSDLTGFNWADVPAILPEVGYLTNPREDRLLTTPSYQRRAARGIAEGIEHFVGPDAG